MLIGKTKAKVLWNPNPLHPSPSWRPQHSLCRMKGFPEYHARQGGGYKWAENQQPSLHVYGNVVMCVLMLFKMYINLCLCNLCHHIVHIALCRKMVSCLIQAPPTVCMFSLRVSLKQHWPTTKMNWHLNETNSWNVGAQVTSTC